jgi:hypothetical protein
MFPKLLRDRLLMRHSVRYHDFYKEVNINQEYGTNMILKAIRTPKPPPDKPEAQVIVVDFGLKECILANKSVHSLSGRTPQKIKSLIFQECQIA